MGDVIENGRGVTGMKKATLQKWHLNWNTGKKKEPTMQTGIVKNEGAALLANTMCLAPSFSCRLPHQTNPTCSPSKVVPIASHFASSPNSGQHNRKVTLTEGRGDDDHKHQFNCSSSTVMGADIWLVASPDHHQKSHMGQHKERAPFRVTATPTDRLGANI